MAVLGPGQLLGYMSALEKSVHGSDAVVREDALLLEIPAQGLSRSSTSAAARLRPSCIARSRRACSSSLGQTNRHLTRLISQARLRGADKESDALEECSAARSSGRWTRRT